MVLDINLELSDILIPWVSIVKLTLLVSENSVSSIPKELLFNFSLVLDDISENVLSLFNILLLLIYVLSKGSLDIDSFILFESDIFSDVNSELSVI